MEHGNGDEDDWDEEDDYQQGGNFDDDDGYDDDFQDDGEGGTRFLGRSVCRCRFGVFFSL